MHSPDHEFSCIDCGRCACDGKDGVYPDFCLTAAAEEGGRMGELAAEAKDLYLHDPQDRLVAASSAQVEYEHYCAYTRIEEICDFAARIGAKKLGIATCVGLIAEARTAAKIFRHHGFTVYGAACKVGAVPKEDIGLDPAFSKVGPHICNPILQAKILNEKKTDLNILIGLCVGHDSLFYKYSDALCTTLVTKDRVLGHNPAAALYQAESYYSKLLK
ncbi:MAG: DUF1847 domain-containing protein [Firmicutes bacterium]|nr:DUF1847 domain-containing protein [Bacillota bacterium]